ncbi:MAG: hypothetical protein M3Y13_02805 [Armatimonadota bacterium]|nr:hypothetical protein [Armatimonadota bacterium]
MAWSKLILAAEAAGIVGSTLIVELRQAHPNNYLGEPIIPILPDDVAGHIRRALAAGWQPLRPNKPFLMKVVSQQLEVTPT